MIQVVHHDELAKIVRKCMTNDPEAVRQMDELSWVLSLRDVPAMPQSVRDVVVRQKQVWEEFKKSDAYFEYVQFQYRLFCHRQGKKVTGIRYLVREERKRVAH
jgi:hypothetical protein